jgi:MYXO-CTERM domain-containing protein
MKKFSFAATAALLGLACASQAGAMTLTFANGVSDNSSSSIASCYSPFTGGIYHDCVTKGFVSDSVAMNTDYFINLDTFGGGGQGLGEESFTSAFNDALSGWTLNQGDMDVMSGITMTVTKFSTGSYDAVGGIGVGPAHNITVQLSGTNTLTQSLVNQLVWIQGLEINYKPGSTAANFSTATNYNTLDDATFNSFSGCTPVPNGSPANVPANTTNGYCDPIYPFQYSNLQFYDAPMGPWPNGSFRGIALLATIDPQAKTVTTYGGVSYGFDDSAAPEPGTWVMLLAGVAAIFAGRRRLTSRG